MAPARRVAAEKALLSVDRRSFGLAKDLSSRLEYHFFNGNRITKIVVNRP